MRKLIEIGDFIGSIYERNSRPSTKGYYVGLCNKYAGISEIVLKSTIAIYIIFFILFASLVVIESVLMEKLIPPLQAYFPGLDQDLSVSLVLVVSYNYVMTIIAFATVGTYSSLLFFIFANVPMVSSVIIAHLDELKDVLLVPNYSLYNVQHQIINIISMHNKYIEYVLII